MIDKDSLVVVAGDFNKVEMKKSKFLEELYPNKKLDEIEVMAKLSTDKELKDLARRHGYDEATIAKKIK